MISCSLCATSAGPPRKNGPGHWLCRLCSSSGRDRPSTSSLSSLQHVDSVSVSVLVPRWLRHGPHLGPHRDARHAPVLVLRMLVLHEHQHDPDITPKDGPESSPCVAPYLPGRAASGPRSDPRGRPELPGQFWVSATIARASKHRSLGPVGGREGSTGSAGRPRVSRPPPALQPSPGPRRSRRGGGLCSGR